MANLMIGIFIGGVLGAFSMALAAASSQADDRREDLTQQRQEGSTDDG